MVLIPGDQDLGEKARREESPLEQLGGGRSDSDSALLASAAGELLALVGDHPQRGRYEVERFADLVTDELALHAAAGTIALGRRYLVALDDARQMRRQRPPPVALANRQFRCRQRTIDLGDAGRGWRRCWRLYIDAIEQERELCWADLFRRLLQMPPQHARQIQSKSLIIIQ